MCDYFSSYFLKLFSFLIISLFCQTSYGVENCDLSSLNRENIREIETKIQKRVKERIDSVLKASNITPNSDIVVPIKIFNELQYRDGVPALYPYILTSFWVHTTKQQELCHSGFSNSICDFNPRFEIFFDKILIRDEQGNPVGEECILSSQIILQIVNITKSIYLGATEIFRSGEPIHQWEIPKI